MTQLGIHYAYLSLYRPLHCLYRFILDAFDIIDSTSVRPRMSHLSENLGGILLGLFWLFLFRFRNNRIHGISIFKRTLIHSEKRNTQGGGDLRTTTSSNRKPGDRRGRPRWISRPKLPNRTCILRIPSKPYSVHSVHSAIGTRMNRMIFFSFRKRNNSQKNTNTVYSE